ncbi:hypothetical protein M9H77_06434 [Catharanthus roseus]|uniref:Uncharacterized protein n=1 Tax=Catharanthus roseus TaxID=4058 RepID=A0ACC0BS45_CATRO|nr:hypothetical protein M9H77_06434 [Catharanthus roseus]
MTTRFLDDKEYKAATNYILLNCDGVEPYIKKYTTELRIHFSSLTESDIQTRISEGFSSWFREKVSLSKLVKSCKGYFVNRFRFHTQERGSSILTYNCGVRISRIDIDVQDIGTIGHESGELELVEIRGRNSIGDEHDNNEDEEEVEYESNDEEEEKEFNRSPIAKCKMVRGGKKNRAHSETSTPALASILPETSTSPATSPAILTPFPQLSYSSSALISTPSSSSTAGTSLRLAPSLFARLLVPPMQDVVDSHILILLTTDSGRKWARHLHNQSYTSYYISKRNSGSTNDLKNFGNREAAIARHRFRQYLLQLPMMPTLRGRSDCGDTCSRRQVNWLYDLVHLSVWCAA